MTAVGAEDRVDPVVGQSMRVVLLGCLVLATASLVWRVSIGYDPWAWLSWGRDLARFDLDTRGGPAWKPFPVLVTTPLSLLGDHAPTAWLLLSRVAGLLTLVLAHRLAARFAGSVAGVLAAGAVLLTPDDGPRFLRLVAEGHGEPFSAAFTLWAIERHLDGHRGQALVLATGVGLLRPEAWPFVLAYAAWIVVRDRRYVPLAAGCLVAIPVLWFGGDWLGSGDPFHGADTARVVFDEHPDHVSDAIGRAWGSVVVPVWVGALACVGSALRRREWSLVVLGIGAVAWCAVVVGENAAFTFAAISRFYLPAAVVLCVLGGIGIVRLVDVAPRGTPRVAAVVLLVALSAPFVATRVQGFGPLVDEMTAQRDLERDLADVIDEAGGADAVRRCGPISYDGTGGKRPALSWLLDVPLSTMAVRARPRPGHVLVRRGGVLEAEILASGRFETVAVNDSWRLLAGGCDDADRRTRDGSRRMLDVDR